MTDLLLAAILIVLVLTYLNLTPGNVGDYLGWKRRTFSRWLNSKQAQRRSRK